MHQIDVESTNAISLLGSESHLDSIAEHPQGAQHLP